MWCVSPSSDLGESNSVVLSARIASEAERRLAYVVARVGSVRDGHKGKQQERQQQRRTSSVVVGVEHLGLVGGVEQRTAREREKQRASGAEARPAAIS
jgi:hypothetical protein